MSKVLCERADLVAIADAVRNKTGKTEEFTLGEIASEINGIEDGVDLPELTEPATEDEVFLNQEYIDANGQKKSGTFTIDEEMSTQNDLIGQIQTALANKAQVSPVLQVKSVTPSAAQQIVTADSGYDGLSKVTVAGDENLVPENIVSGANIFGVEGTAEGGGIETCNVTIDSFNNISYLSYTAYENGELISRLINNSNTSYITLNNVICGSAISFSNMYDFNGFTHSHDSQLVGRYTVYMWVLSAPTMAGVNATISIYDDD